MIANNAHTSEGNPPEPCRAKRANGPGLVFCLTPNKTDCEHVGHIENIRFCLNPDREAIIARTLESI